MSTLKQLYEIDRYIDTKALGYSARVAHATRWDSGQDVALKVLRLEHVGDPRVWEQFAVEVDLLALLQQNATVVRLIDCGYVSDQANELPAGGDILSCGREVDKFRQEIAAMKRRGWRPYIGQELLSGEHCLLNLIRGADGEGRRPLRLPTEDGLALAMQFAEFMQQAHRLNVVYWDHKPEHVYWVGGRLRLIDFNVSRRLEANLSGPVKAAEKGQDLRHLAASVLYTVFTGRDFRYHDQAPRARASDPESVVKRYDGVRQLDFSMDNTLPPALCELLNAFTAANAFDLTADSLLLGLQNLAATIGWEVAQPASEAARGARMEIQQGLAALRSAQEEIEKAREHFLRAHTMNPADKESERLYREAGQFHSHRVLP